MWPQNTIDILTLDARYYYFCHSVIPHTAQSTQPVSGFHTEQRSSCAVKCYFRFNSDVGQHISNGKRNEKKKFMRIVYPHIKRQPNGPASTVRQTAFSTVCTAIAAFDCSFALLWFIHSDAQQTYRRSSLILSILFVSILGRQKWIDSFCILSGGAPCVCVLWKLQFAALPMDGSMNKIFRFRTIVGIPRKPLLIHR